jgi:ATP-dependent RNA helicase DDX35
MYLLQLKALGIDNLAKFDFMSPPPSDMMIRALEFLYSLKAIDDEGRLTKPFGARMAEVPLDPMMAAIVSPSIKAVLAELIPQLLNSHEFRCGEEILTIAAMTSVQNAFIQIDGGTKGMMADLERRKFTAEEGDHLSLLNGELGASDLADGSIQRIHPKRTKR